MRKSIELFIILLLISGPGICNAEWLTGATYEDCILKNIEKAKTPEAVEAVKQACKKKFPKTFDFEYIAKQSGVKSWQEATINPEYINLTKGKKEGAQSQYFEEVIIPNIHPDFIQEAKLHFFKYVKSIQKISSPNEAKSADAKSRAAD
ncbi:MAG: hypothetical protein JRD47_12150 [Deltaproteobacteria bacterium]|nr:hypothetical protein [Deltaproteobacteria bacterium]